MAKILVIGGGAMGSAFTVPCIDNNNKVTITEPYSKNFIRDLTSKKKFHSSLKLNLSKKLKFKKFSKNLWNEKFDLIVIALSLNGIDFIGKELKNYRIKTPILVLTKGLKYEKKTKKLSATMENLSLYIDLDKRKVTEFEDEKVKIMDEFIDKNKVDFKIENLMFKEKLKK